LLRRDDDLAVGVADEGEAALQRLGDGAVEGLEPAADAAEAMLLMGEEARHRLPEPRQRVAEPLPRASDHGVERRAAQPLAGALQPAAAQGEELAEAHQQPLGAVVEALARGI